MPLCETRFSISRDEKLLASMLGIDLRVDGKMVFATLPNFQNLQESPAGFARTGIKAMLELLKQTKGELG